MMHKCVIVFTVCIQMPSEGFGLSLEFDGYELSRSSYNQACNQGQWIIQNRRYCISHKESSWSLELIVIQFVWLDQNVEQNFIKCV